MPHSLGGIDAVLAVAGSVIGRSGKGAARRQASTGAETRATTRRRGACPGTWGQGLMRRFRQRYVAGARSWDRRISLRRVVSLNARTPRRGGLPARPRRGAR